MGPVRQVTFLLTIGIVLSQKSNDEGRPYEFGFTIDGQQHRHEKKDQNGIVQGEFGFITADGVYHVTVYATDENGNFKILSMKNIRISAPLDGSPATGPISPEAGKYLNKERQIQDPKPAMVTSPQLQSQGLQQQQQQQQQQSLQRESESSQKTQKDNQSPEIVTRKYEPHMFTRLSTIKPACGGCGYVTTEKFIPKQKLQIPNSSFDTVTGHNQHSPATSKQNSQDNNGNIIQYPDNAPNKKYQPEIEMVRNIQQRVNPANNIMEINNAENVKGKSLQQNFQYNENDPFQRTMNNVQNSRNENGFVSPFNMNVLHSIQNETSPFSGLNAHNQSVTDVNQQAVQQYNFKKEEISNVQGITSVGDAIGPNPLITSKDEISKIPPVSVSDNIIHVSGTKPIDIAIKDKYPGMVNGLPEGIEENDIKDILYKFHYTVGFHGHYEKGLSNGAKIGGYFVNGRDGYSRVVTYIADENGYRPKFKLINLGLDSPDTPNEDSEKQFGLKSFEFIWYPIE